MSLTPQQITIIKATVPVVQEHGNAITTLFYKNILDAIPALNNIFNQTNQKNEAQPRALAGALAAYAANIDNLAVLSDAVERICQKHASLFIKPEHYPIVGKYLLEAMGDVLGAALKPEILDAWTAAYGQLAKIMIDREAQLYSEAGEWKEWRDFKIAKKVDESSIITSFYLEPVDGKPLPLFKPGQYISVQVHVPQLGYLQSRQYSLSDQPNEKYYRISVKREDALESPALNTLFEAGLISNTLHSTKNEGDIVQVSPPQGEFFLDLTKNATSPVILISAGVGITPMISILNTLVEMGSRRPISYIHAARSKEVHAFDKHVQGIVTSHSNIKSWVFVKNLPVDDDGIQTQHLARRMDLSKIREEALHLEDSGTTYFICGPGRFMLDMRRALWGYGVAEERIKLEVFGTGDADVGL
ncbi:flavohemoglobin [Sclerotinia borealis F-4128]|uniref:nitric oxide dioxygenase n=1 Tax=Sclerotinia borealis (strain F-4128) TaxID=1432307 RepID=W9C2H0_SCLBF|nr:flavohemoglobin [Sclerotinia borealis F-4128]